MDEEPEALDDLNLDRGELPKGFFDDPMLDAKVEFALINYLIFKCVIVKNMVFCMFY